MRTARLLIVVTVLSLLSMWAGAQEPYEEWVATYDGPDHLLDSGRSIGVDALGNVYVSGNSNTPHGGFVSDYVTIAYGSDGVELWLTRYDGPAGYHDYAKGMALDSAGNMYVTGESWGLGTLEDYATIMYDASGNEKWVARYDGPGGRSDEAKAVALSGDGSVCVTGRSYGGTDTDYDYATIRYNSDGDELWVARYSNEPVLGNDHATAIAVGPDGSVYVTGHSWGDGTAEDFATVKYTPDGHEEWVARYNGPDDGDDEAEAIAVDDLGNVYVTGRSWADASEYDYATIKYDPDGNEKWVARYNGPGNKWDLAWGLVLDNEGCVFVTGGSHNHGWDDHDYATIKYDAEGNQIWLSRYGGPAGSLDSARDIVLDSSGNAYVTGNSTDYYTGYGEWIYDCATVKYDATGTQEWVVRYDGPSNETDGGAAIAVDDANVYVTGYSWNDGTDLDVLTIKYSSELSPVEGVFYAATVESGAVMLRWTVPYLFGIEGFNVYRATNPDGPFARINTDSIEPISPGAYEDTTIWPGTTFWYELRAIVDGSEEIVSSGAATATTGGELSIRLYAAAPNPFVESTSVRFDIAVHVDRARIAVYDVAGRLVKTLVDGRVTSGPHEVHWDGTDDAGVQTASGVYVVRLDTGGQNRTSKVVRVR